MAADNNEAVASPKTLTPLCKEPVSSAIESKVSAAGPAFIVICPENLALEAVISFYVTTWTTNKCRFST